MFLRAIKGLNGFRDQPKLSRENRSKAREFIRELFSVGFSPEEIVFFAGGKSSHWKLSTVKKYCARALG
jgi:hypothetical protein